MTIQDYQTISSVKASTRFTSKLSNPTIEADRSEFATDLESKIAAIQDAFLEAEVASAQSLEPIHTESGQHSTSPNRAASVGNKFNTSRIPTTYNSDGVYNEGKLCCSDELNSYFKEAAEKYNIDVKLLKSVAFIESSFRPNATSKCGAMGIMQLMPSAAKQYGAKDPYDPRQNIMAGAKILSTFLKRYDGDIEKTLAAYNAGPGNVKKACGVPEYTRGYINKVLKYYNS